MAWRGWFGILIAFSVLAVASARAADSAHSELFAAAKKDSSKVAPLILSASRAIPERPTAEGHALAEKLRPYLVRAFFSSESLADEASLGIRRHFVKEGDTPAKIANRYCFDSALLPKLNPKFDANRLKIDSRLKVLDLSDKSLRIVVDRKRFRLALWRTVATQKGSQRLLIGYFPIACGAPKSPTPGGETRIAVAQRDPSWRNPKTGKVYGPHDKGNVLGGYWLGLDAKSLGKKGYGIHGYTGAPPEKWIGKAASSGCIRMLKDDIVRVFRVARVGTKVRIE